MGDYRKLRVWQRAQAFAVRVDAESRLLSRGHGEAADQLRGAALSIPTNLAEGACRGSDGEFARFVGIAIGSAAEAESLLVHLAEVEGGDWRAAGALAEELTTIRKMLFRLRSALLPQCAPATGPVGHSSH